MKVIKKPPTDLLTNGIDNIKTTGFETMDFQPVTSLVGRPDDGKRNLIRFDYNTCPISFGCLCHIFPQPFLYSPHTLLILWSYSPHTLVILSSYSGHTLLILSSYSPHTLLILSSYKKAIQINKQKQIWQIKFYLSIPDFHLPAG
jgi:hypothetical protein